MKFTRNSEGFAEIIKSAGVRAAVEAAANAVAGNVSGQGLVASSKAYESGPEIVGVVEMSTTDRPNAHVTIKHPAGLAMQAKHGVLTKAASSAGLEVRAK